MKTTNYRLQREIEQLKPSSQKAWFRKYITDVLESDKPYYTKADYIGLSIQELQNKIDYLSSDIKELQDLKKRLTEAKSIALEVTASVLADYGIDRIDGTAISSLTITPAKVKSKINFSITNSKALIELGYAKVVVDEDAIKSAIKSKKDIAKIKKYVDVNTTIEKIPSRIKVNLKRNGADNSADKTLDYVA